VPRDTQAPRLGRVLVVDDAEAMRLTLEGVLSEDFQVESAATLLDAQKALEERDFNAVITDYEMPDGTGAQLLEWLQKNRPNVGGILLTGHANYADVRAMQRSGRYLVMFKPVDPAQIVAWVRNTITMTRLAGLRSATPPRLAQEGAIRRQPFEEIAFEATKSSASEFVARHPGPFLLQMSEPQDFGDMDETAHGGSFSDTAELPKDRIKLGKATMPLYVFDLAPRTGTPSESRKLKIGRDEKNDIVLGYRVVSREHALITIERGGWTIIDVSRNGLHVDGRRATPRYPIALGYGANVHISAGILLIFASATGLHGAITGSRDQ
jgi:DNA-binding NarL/FixJ family response regulator